MEHTNKLMTVRGPIDASVLGKTLPHEHIMCDFIGAEDTGKHRYHPREVVRTMKPYLAEIKERGWNGFVDCTPDYIGRDVSVLRGLSEAMDIHIITNTGFYGASDDNFLPRYVFDEAEEKLAERWIAEWEEGIDGTGIKPGFIKIGVDPGPLSEVDRKIVIAAVKACSPTGLTVACHTGEEEAARETAKTALSEGIDPECLIIVHADGIDDEAFHRDLAELGVWLEFDGVGPDTLEKHLRIIPAFLESGHIDRLLLSHDAGWYWVGEPQGGYPDKIRPYTTIEDSLLPALRKNGISEEEIRKITEENPARAFSCSRRS